MELGSFWQFWKKVSRVDFLIGAKNIILFLLLLPFSYMPYFCCWPTLDNNNVVESECDFGFLLPSTIQHKHYLASVCVMRSAIHHTQNRALLLLSLNNKRATKLPQQCPTTCSSDFHHVFSTFLLRRLFVRARVARPQMGRKEPMRWLA